MLALECACFLVSSDETHKFRHFSQQCWIVFQMNKRCFQKKFHFAFRLLDGMLFDSFVVRSSLPYCAVLLAISSEHLINYFSFKISFQRVFLWFIAACQISRTPSTHARIAVSISALTNAWGTDQLYLPFCAHTTLLVVEVLFCSSVSWKTFITYFFLQSEVHFFTRKTNFLFFNFRSAKQQSVPLHVMRQKLVSFKQVF